MAQARGENLGCERMMLLFWLRVQLLVSHFCPFSYASGEGKKVHVMGRGAMWPNLLVQSSILPKFFGRLVMGCNGPGMAIHL